MVITSGHYPAYGVDGNTHNVYKFHATDTKRHFGFFYCADSWTRMDAGADFKKRAKSAFGE